jgi:hypothetical protein
LWDEALPIEVRELPADLAALDVQLTITADSASSNSCRSCLWKTEVQRLADHRT